MLNILKWGLKSKFLKESTKWEIPETCLSKTHRPDDVISLENFVLNQKDHYIIIELLDFSGILKKGFFLP